jgi:hypothetical protein
MNLLITEKPHTAKMILEVINNENIDNFYFNSRLLKYKKIAYTKLINPEYEIINQNIFYQLNKKLYKGFIEQNKFDFFNKYEKIIFCLEPDYSGLRATNFFINNFLKNIDQGNIYFVFLDNYLEENIKNSFKNKYSYEKYLNIIKNDKEFYIKKDYIHFNFLNLTEKFTQYRLSSNICNLIGDINKNEIIFNHINFIYYISNFNYLNNKLFSVTSREDIINFLNENNFLIKCKDNNLRLSNQKFIFNHDYLFDRDIHFNLNKLIYSEDSFYNVKFEIYNIFKELETYLS